LWGPSPSLCVSVCVSLYTRKTEDSSHSYTIFFVLDKPNSVNQNLQHTNANSASISEMEIEMQRAKSEKRARGYWTHTAQLRPGRVRSGRLHRTTRPGRTKTPHVETIRGKVGVPSKP
jgi:hypothetical protein